MRLTALCLSILISTAEVFAQAPGAIEPTVVFVGDSITQGYGVLPQEAFPERIQGLLEAKGIKVKVVNAGISGSVTADADRRVRYYAKLKPEVYFICLGANDALKATPTPVIKKNLEAALTEAQKSGAQVVLAGMKVYTNFGQKYNDDLEKVYKDLAREFKVPFIPFLIGSIALDKSKMQTDAKHPNAAGHEVLAREVLPWIEKELKAKRVKG